MVERGGSGTGDFGKRGVFSVANGTPEDQKRDPEMEEIEVWDCHPECPVRLMDENSGERPGQLCEKPSDCSGSDGWGSVQLNRGARGYDDTGGASRFFYCAKASKEERGPGNNHPTVKPLDLMKWLVGLVRMPEGNLILDPFSGSGTTGLACAILNVPFVGFEIDENSSQIANRRIRSTIYGDVSVKEYKAGQMGLFDGIEDE